MSRVRLLKAQPIPRHPPSQIAKCHDFGRCPVLHSEIRCVRRATLLLVQRRCETMLASSGPYQCSRGVCCPESSQTSELCRRPLERNTSYFGRQFALGVRYLKKHGTEQVC